MALARSSLAFRIQARLLRRFPRFAVSQMMKVESTHEPAEISRITADVIGDPDKMAHSAPSSPRVRRLACCATGFDNDLEQFASIRQLPLDRVNCPTLVVHGTHDGDVPFAHAEHSESQDCLTLSCSRSRTAGIMLRLSDGDDAYLAGRDRVPEGTPEASSIAEGLEASSATLLTSKQSGLRSEGLNR